MVHLAVKTFDKTKLEELLDEGEDINTNRLLISSTSGYN